MDGTRIDRSLWSVRLVKTRSLAAQVCRAGHVRINGVRAKPAATVKVGDTVRTQRDAIAPDGSQVRLLVRLPSGSMAHFELGPGEVSRPTQHRTVSEEWYIVQGLGRMWRRQDGTEREIDLREDVPTAVEARWRSRC